MAPKPKPSIPAPEESSIFTGLEITDSPAVTQHDGPGPMFVHTSESKAVRALNRTDGDKNAAEAPAALQSATAAGRVFDSPSLGTPAINSEFARIIVNDVFTKPMRNKQTGQVVMVGRIEIRSYEPDFVFDEFTRRGIYFINWVVTRRFMSQEVKYRPGQSLPVPLSLNDWKLFCGYTSDDNTDALNQFNKAMSTFISMQIRYYPDSRRKQYGYFFVSKKGGVDEENGQYIVTLTDDCVDYLFKPTYQKLSIPMVLFSADIKHYPLAIDLGYELYSWDHQYMFSEKRREMGVKDAIKRVASIKDPKRCINRRTGKRYSPSQINKQVILPIIRTLIYLEQMGLIRWDIMPRGAVPSWDKHEHLQGLKLQRETVRDKRTKEVKREWRYPRLQDIEDWVLAFDLLIYDDEFAEAFRQSQIDRGQIAPEPQELPLEEAQQTQQEAQPQPVEIEPLEVKTVAAMSLPAEQQNPGGHPTGGAS